MRLGRQLLDMTWSGQLLIATILSFKGSYPAALMTYQSFQGASPWSRCLWLCCRSPHISRTQQASALCPARGRCCGPPCCCISLSRGRLMSGIQAWCCKIKERDRPWFLALSCPYQSIRIVAALETHMFALRIFPELRFPSPLTSTSLLPLCISIQQLRHALLFTPLYTYSAIGIVPAINFLILNCPITKWMITIALEGNLCSLTF